MGKNGGRETERDLERQDSCASPVTELDTAMTRRASA